MTADRQNNMTIVSDAGKRAKRSDQIADALRRQIVMGEYPEKSFLPSERDLAARFGAGRMTVSEALDQLTREGIIVRTHGRGTQVVSTTAAHIPTTIRVIHPMHPNARLIWREAFEILRGIEAAIESSEFRLERFCSGDPLGGPETLELPDEPCPTVFLEGPRSLHNYMAQLDEAGIPFVIANLESDDLSYPATKCDHAHAMRRATTLLAEMGHRRIAYIGINSSHLFYGEARDGYAQGLKEAGLEPAPELVVEANVARMATVLSGYCATQQLLQLENPPTAIVCARDQFADGAWHAIEHAGLEVGHDVSLIGFDDVSGSIRPSNLTTFREPCYEMGEKAALMLIDQMVGNAQNQKQITFLPELTMRLSAGPAPRGNA